LNGLLGEPGSPGARLPGWNDLPRLEYTRRVFAEAMRLYPPAYAMGRQAMKATEVAGHPVARGVIVILPTWVVHRDPRWYEEGPEMGGDPGIDSTVSGRRSRRPRRWSAR
jgi:cytochrome P450